MPEGSNLEAAPDVVRAGRASMRGNNLHCKVIVPIGGVKKVLAFEWTGREEDLIERVDGGERLHKRFLDPARKAAREAFKKGPDAAPPLLKLADISYEELGLEEGVAHVKKVPEIVKVIRDKFNNFAGREDLKYILDNPDSPEAEAFKNPGGMECYLFIGAGKQLPVALYYLADMGFQTEELRDYDFWTKDMKVVLIDKSLPE